MRPVSGTVQRGAALLSLTAIFVLAVALPVAGAEIAVTTFADSLAPGSCSLRQALRAADGNAAVGTCTAGTPGPDTIHLPAGTYTLTIAGAGEDGGLSGDLDIASEVVIEGDGRDVTVIEAAAAPGTAGDRVLHILPGGAATLEGVSVRNGNVQDIEARGGGIRNDGTLTLRDCAVAANRTSGSGGGVYAGPHSTTLIERCEITDNAGDGGGIFSEFATVTLHADGVRRNRAVQTGGGGLLEYRSNLTIEQTEFESNHADDSRFGGGGILSLGGEVTMRTSALIGNSALGTASTGVFDELGGGGMVAFGNGMGAENSTFSGNRADGTRWGGGGLLALFSNARLAYTTFAGNDASAGGSMSRVDGASASRTVLFANSILALSAGAECSALAALAGSGNLIDDSSCAGTGSLGPATGLDPALSTTGNPTRFHRLLAGSNAINATTGACLGIDGTLLAMDQRATLRPQGTACDLGAVERVLSAQLTVTSATATPSTWPEPGGTTAYGLGITNGGSLAFTLQALSSAQYGSLDGQGTCSLPQVIQPGGIYNCAFSAVVASNPGPFPVAFHAAGGDLDLNPGSGDASVVVTIVDVPPTAALAATPSATAVTTPGGTVSITVRVNNTSPADPVDLVSLSSTLAGNLNGRGTCSLPQTIALGSSYTCSYDVFVGGGVGQQIESITATVQDDDGNQAQASTQIAFQLVIPSIPALSTEVLTLLALLLGFAGLALLTLRQS